MRNAEGVAGNVWLGPRRGVNRRRSIGKASATGRDPYCFHTGSGGAAPVRPGAAAVQAGGGGDNTCPRFAGCGAAQGNASEPLPIWLAALSASGCQAVCGASDHAIRWSCVCGRALYTNSGAESETIQPLGVRLERGQTLAVYWIPGSTEYTFEVYRGAEYLA